jgi:hypothetical protein
MEWVTNFSTWSEMVNLTAVTTVVLISAESDTSDSCNLGSKLAGSIRVSFPRHSATTFRVPSSPHSQCRNNCCQIAGTNGWSSCTPPGLKDWHVMIWNTIPTPFLSKGCSTQHKLQMQTYSYKRYVWFLIRADIGHNVWKPWLISLCELLLFNAYLGLVKLYLCMKQ